MKLENHQIREIMIKCVDYGRFGREMSLEELAQDAFSIYVRACDFNLQNELPLEILNNAQYYFGSLPEDDELRDQYDPFQIEVVA